MVLRVRSVTPHNLTTGAHNDSCLCYRGGRGVRIERPVGFYWSCLVLTCNHLFQLTSAKKTLNHMLARWEYHQGLVLPDSLHFTCSVTERFTCCADFVFIYTHIWSSWTILLSHDLHGSLSDSCSSVAPSLMNIELFLRTTIFTKKLTFCRFPKTKIAEFLVVQFGLLYSRSSDFTNCELL